MQNFNFIDNGTYVTIETVIGTVVSAADYPKNTLYTEVFGEILCCKFFICNEKWTSFSFKEYVKINCPP